MEKKGTYKFVDLGCHSHAPGAADITTIEGSQLVRALVRKGYKKLAKQVQAKITIYQAQAPLEVYSFKYNGNREKLLKYVQTELDVDAITPQKLPAKTLVFLEGVVTLDEGLRAVVLADLKLALQKNEDLYYYVPYPAFKKVFELL